VEVVVDASIVMRWVVSQEGSARAQEFLAASLQAGVRLMAPNILRYEVLGALSRLYRRRHMTQADVEEAYWLFRNFRPELRDTADIIAPALNLALKHQFSYWDALYVALAELRKCPLVTGDARLYRSVARSFPDVRLL